jgi:hypothetical protein
MVVSPASQLTIPEDLVRRKDMAFDRVPLVQRAEAARWVIAELGLEPYLRLVHAAWALEAKSSSVRYAD